ncbi:MAG: HdeD family acid-resistance protein [Gammaproteobacteria bacterium]
MSETMENRPVLAAAGRGVCDFCKRTWWVFLIGGAAAVIFGILAFMNPGIALLVLATYFAAMVLVDGGINAWGAVKNREKDGWWIMLLLGILGIAVGGYALFHPQLSVPAFVFLVAFTAIFIGVLLVSLGFRIRKEIETEWILYLTGAVSIIFGALIFLRPLEGSLSVVYLIASWAVLLGALKIWFAFKVKNFPENMAERVQARA